MTHEQHRQRHIQLHENLDELIADWIAQTPAMPSSSSVSDLICWSHKQTLSPTRNPFMEKEAHMPSIEVDRG